MRSRRAGSLGHMGMGPHGRPVLRPRAAVLVGIGLLAGVIAIAAMTLLLSPADAPEVRPVEVSQPGAAERDRRREQRRERARERRQDAPAPSPPPAAPAPAPAPPSADDDAGEGDD